MGITWCPCVSQLRGFRQIGVQWNLPSSVPSRLYPACVVTSKKVMLKLNGRINGKKGMNMRKLDDRGVRLSKPRTENDSVVKELGRYNIKP